MTLREPAKCSEGSNELGGNPQSATEPNLTLCQPCLEPPSRSLAAVNCIDDSGSVRTSPPYFPKHLLATPLDAGPLSTAMRCARPCNGSFEADTVERMHNVFTPPMWRSSLNFFFHSLSTLALSLRLCRCLVALIASYNLARLLCRIITLLLSPHHRRIFVAGIGFFSLCFLMTSLGGQLSAKRPGEPPFTARAEGRLPSALTLR